jgi:uracil-DNA glycosylase family 4
VDAKAPLAHCDDCPLRDRPLVAGYGPRRTDRVIVGEAPGETEVVLGMPFVGKAGSRLNEALTASGVDRSTVYITNTVLCHPAGNESPPPREAISACHERLINEVQQRMPRKVLALGGTAGKALTGDSRPIEQLRLLRPAPSPYLDGYVEVRVAYHPSALTRNPAWPERFDEDVGWLGEL